MSGEYTRTIRVRWSETNAVGQVGFAGYLRYLMETAWAWGEAGGLGLAESSALGIAWIIRETEMEIYRPLFAGDVFDFSIWLVEWRRMRGTRCFEIRLQENQEIVAQGVQSVVTLDVNTLRPFRVPEELMQNFVTENPRVFDQRKIPEVQPRPEIAFITQREVEWRDLDSLEHVNNAMYASFAENAAVHALSTVGWPPSQLKAHNLAVANRRFHIRYRSPAVWGEQLTVTAYLTALTLSGGAWAIELSRVSDGSTVVQCTIEWSMADRESGEERALPGDLVDALAQKVSP